MQKKGKSKKSKSKKKSYKGKEEKDQAGRPSKFRKEYIEQIHKLAVIGYTDVKIADFLGIATSTLDNWKKEHPELLGRLHAARDGKMFEVIGTMYERAVGYTHAEEKIFCSDGVVTRVKTKKHYPPETAAGIFLATNRNPDEWKRDRNIEGSPDEPVPVKVEINVVDKRKKG